MIKTVIFDFDGVIADTETERFADVQRLLRKHGYILEAASFPVFIGKKTGHFLRQKFPDMPAQLIQQIVDERRKQQHTYRIINGLPELLQFLRSQRIQTAITTGSGMDVVRKSLAENKLFFDFIVTGEMFRSSKPDPECYLLTLKKAASKPSETIIIEDSLAGIAGCRAAGWVR